jgi:hypothetical protein
VQLYGCVCASMTVRRCNVHTAQYSSQLQPSTYR